MTRDQLEGVAERAWRRASTVEGGAGALPTAIRLRLGTHDAVALRSALEPRLEEHTKHWRLGGVSVHDGIERLDYQVEIRKKSSPEELLALVRAACGSQLVDAEVEA